jgi:SWIM zinc finger
VTGHPNLKFLIKGGATKPYRVVFQGHGSMLTAKCSCPAGRNGTFCKHVAAPLIGDVTNISSGIGLITALKSHAIGSPLVSRALGHNPKRIPMRSWIDDRYDESDDMRVTLQASLLDAPSMTQLSIDQHQLQYFSFFKNGKLRKTPTAIIMDHRKFSLDASDIIVSPLMKGRPFYTRFGSNRAKTFKLLSTAIASLEESMQQQLIHSP